VSKWNGTAWVPLGNGVGNNVYSMCVYDLGAGPELFLGGQFSQAGGGMTSYRLAAWQACQTPIATFCFGDATVAACPCTNTGIFGHGCDNSAGTGGARLYTSGDTSPDTLVLTASGLLPNATTLFFQGNAYSLGSMAFGDGLRCVTGSVLRLYLKGAQAGQASAPVSGDPSISARSAALGDPIPPGSTRYYQAWYRDPNTTYCSAGTYNLTNGVRVVW
jgi:hypothetical protein